MEQSKIVFQGVSSLRGLSAAPDAPVSRFNSYKLDPLLLSEDEGFNLRDYSDPDVQAHIEALVDSYTEGRYVPPILVRMSEGRIVPIEGHCRRRAALIVRQKVPDFRIECNEIKANDVERISIMLHSAEGLKLKPLEIAAGYLRLVRLGHSNVQIAKMMGKSSVRIDQLLLLANANADVQQLVRSGAVSADVAIEVIRQHGENAGKYLQSKMETAAGQGKTKVTKSVVQGFKVPSKIAMVAAKEIDLVVASVLSDERRRNEIERLSTLEPVDLQDLKVEISAKEFLALMAVQAQIETARVKQSAGKVSKPAKPASTQSDSPNV
jgi:ParB-like chromosome segregation protein Spo0J